MATLKFQDRQNFENFLRMKSGHVLDFINREFQDFIFDSVNIDIDNQKYGIGSKANRFRQFISLEDNHTVGKALLDLCEFKNNNRPSYEPFNFELYECCIKSAKLLIEESIIQNIDSIKPIDNAINSTNLALIIKDHISQNNPEFALDRLHTFSMSHFRNLCLKHNIEFTDKESLNAVFGKYVKYLKSSNLIDSEMSIKILSFSKSLIDSFNEIRNNKSYAHDNSILNYQESVLIFNNMTNLFKFLEHIENSIKTNNSNQSNKEEYFF